MEFVPPKYQQLVSELQRRIADGTYEPGATMPSEHDLVTEFGVSRPTVVRALAVLREGGWIESRQGKGRFVRGRPALDSLGGVRPGQAMLLDSDGVSGDTIDVGTVAAPARIAGLLEVKPRAKVFRRRILPAGDAPPRLVSLWMPVDVADGTALTSAGPIGESLRDHLEARKDVRLDHVLERITARTATAEEAKLLGLARSTTLIVVFATARDATSRPVLVAEIALPAHQHELEDAYSLS
jgi:GntR family transcriptional regulator